MHGATGLQGLAISHTIRITDCFLSLVVLFHVSINVESPLGKVVYCQENWQNNNQSKICPVAKVDDRNTTP